MSMTMPTIVLKFSKQLGVRAAEDIVAGLAPLIRSMDAQERVDIVMDLGDVTRIYPTGLAMIGSAVLEAQSLGICNSLKIHPPEDAEIHRYITRMGFYKLLGADVPYRFQLRDSSGRFVEVQRVINEESIIPLSLKWMEIIKEQCGVHDGSTWISPWILRLC